MRTTRAARNGALTVEAVGCVLWRRSPVTAELELCLVHRPKYDDWSWPKGKLKRGEDALAGALREVAEETGYTAVPAAELPSTRYLAHGRPKRVRYWAAEAVSGTFAPNDEVDRVLWLPRTRPAATSPRRWTPASWTPSSTPSARPADSGRAPRPHRTVLRGSPLVHVRPSAASPVLPNFGLTRCGSPVHERLPDEATRLTPLRTPPNSGRRPLEGTKVKLQRMNRRALALGALAVTGALALTACGSDDTGGGEGGGASATAQASSNIDCGDAKGQLQASGSSAQKNAIDAWVKQYTAACKDVQINYNPTGSGAGITAFTQGQTAFVYSDSALKPEEVEASKKVCTDGQGIDLPMVGGPIAVGYNVPGVDALTLDASTLAKIFDNKITKWNDPAIAKLNDGVELPDLKIQAFHRSDESGTTDNFTKYLKAAAPKDWKYEPGKSWEAEGGQSAQGSSGVAQQVKQTNGAISYFELSYAADGIKTVDIKTEATEPVKATIENATAAIGAAKVVGTGKDLALELDYTPTAEGRLPDRPGDVRDRLRQGQQGRHPARHQVLPELRGLRGRSGPAGGRRSYAPMPTEIITKVRETIA